MTKAPAIRRYAVEQTARLLGRLVFEIHRAARTHDPDAIHDLRVSIRRFNQGLRVFSQFFPAREARKIRRRLRVIMDAAAKVRDRDIARELFLLAGVAGVEPICQTLAAQRRENEIELRDLLKRFETRDYSSRWRARLGL
jgi:CHAD domain-containing protein